MAAIGPCMFVAPLVPVLMILAIPLWPVAIVTLSALWLVTWPLERLLHALGVRQLDGAARRVARWLGYALRPWSFFEVPKRDSTSSK